MKAYKITGWVGCKPIASTHPDYNEAALVALKFQVAGYAVDWEITSIEEKDEN